MISSNRTTHIQVLYPIPWCWPSDSPEPPPCYSLYKHAIIHYIQGLSCKYRSSIYLSIYLSIYIYISYTWHFPRFSSHRFPKLRPGPRRSKTFTSQFSRLKPLEPQATQLAPPFSASASEKNMALGPWGPEIKGIFIFSSPTLASLMMFNPLT